MSKRNRLLSLIVIFAFLLIVAAGCGGQAEKSEDEKDKEKDTSKQEQITIQLAHESPDSHPKGVWANDFAEILEEKSDGNIKVEVFPQGQLYSSPKAALEAVRNGVIQMSIASTGYMSGVVPEFEIFDLPMIFPDQDAFYKAQDGKTGEKVMNLLEDKGYIGLGFISNIPLDAFTKDSLVTIDDFKGAKLRVHSGMLESSVKVLGGNPISMAASEVFTAMEQGMVDGMFTTCTYAAPNKFYEVAPHMTKCRISAICYPVVTGKKFWDGLSSEQKSLIEEAAEEAIELNREKLAEIETEAIKTLEEGGITIHELSDEQRNVWKEKLSAVYEESKSRIGEDFIKETREFVAE